MNINNKLFDLLLILEIGQETLKAVNNMQMQLDNIQNDVHKLKIAMVGHLPEEARNQVFQATRYETIQSLAEFTSRREEEVPYKQLVVCIFISHF